MNDPDDQWDDDEWTDEELGWNEPDDSETETVRCPACGEEIYSESERCTFCGAPVDLPGSAVWLGKPAWYVLLGMLGIIAVLLAMSGLAAWL